MEERLCCTPAGEPSRPVVAAAMLLASVLLLASCAPDAVRSTEATAYNAFIRKIGTVCQPLMIGDKNISQMLRMESGGNDNGYDYFLDATSKLYYNRVTFAAYRENLTGFFGAGTSNDASFACIQSNLPVQRPNAPSPY